MMQKSSLRQQCIHRRQALSAHQRTTFSQRIQQHLEDFIKKTFAKTSLNILCYQSLASEVSTSSIFYHEPHHYFAPVTQDTGHMHWQAVHQHTLWKPGNFHILEPVDGQIWQASQTPSLLICPIVGFDQQGNRMGMGKGYFDRWLADHQHAIDCILGLAFSCQACASIPVEPHDIPLHTIITEEGYISCQNT